MRIRIQVAAIIVAAINIVGMTAGAQVKPPAVTLTGRDVRTPLLVSAAQGDFNTRVLQAALEARFPTSASKYPKDSIRAEIASRAGAWLARLNSHTGQPIPGMQLDNLAMLSLFASRDDEA